MERTKSQPQLPLPITEQASKSLPTMPKLERPAARDAFEPIRSPLTKSPPRAEGARIIEESRKLEDLRQRPNELASNMAGHLKSARGELSPDSISGNTRLAAIRNYSDSTQKIVGYLRGYMNGTVKTINDLKTGLHLSTTLEQALESETIRPMVARVKSGLIEPQDARELLVQAAEVLTQHPTIQKAVKDIDKGELASQTAAELMFRTKGEKREKNENLGPTPYSVQDYVVSKFDQLLKASDFT